MVDAMKLKIYVDTSVIGGCLDEEFKEPSERLFRKFMSGQAVAVVSDVTVAELTGAPEGVRAILANLPTEHVEYVSMQDESIRLADEYIQYRAVPTSMLADAQHIALATVARVDVLVSWNFKHIVNLDRIRKYNSVNLREGYPMLEIRSPQEVLQDDEE